MPHQRGHKAWHIMHYLKRRTNQAWPSVSMTQKSMTHRDTAYLKKPQTISILYSDI